jgi:hypothetical protein
MTHASYVYQYMGREKRFTWFYKVLARSLATTRSRFFFGWEGLSGLQEKWAMVPGGVPPPPLHPCKSHTRYPRR